MPPIIPQSDAPWALRSREVVTSESVRPATVIVRGERIEAVLDQAPDGLPVEDLGDKMLLPGIVDAHVHINEPGRTHWEGFASATRAAAAGGITTLVDMPLNSSPVTTTVAALNAKRAAAAGKLWVDCGFHAGVVPGNADEIAGLIAAGVCGFKAFLCHSGIDEFPNSTEADLKSVMPKLAAAGLPLLVHAELLSPLPAGFEAQFVANPKSYGAYLATRPPEWEVAAIGLLFKLAREYGCHVHIVHLSAAREARWLIEIARAVSTSFGFTFTVETCPHYLTFAAEEIPDGDPRYKCAPPIRGQDERALLREMLLDGRLDTIGSDHSPAPPDLKHLEDGNLQAAWGGIASLQLLLPATWTAVSDPRIFAAMTQRSAKLVGLDHRKGAIAPGHDADLVVFDYYAEFMVTPEMLHHRHKATPYEDRTLRGVVTTTYLRGHKIYERGQFFGGPCGQLLERPLAQ